MNTEATLTLAHWLSPSYPVGAFAYSHGLETLIQSRALTTAQDLQCWLLDVLEHGSGRADAVLVSCAYQAEADELAHIDASARAFAGSGERLRETVLQGAAFVRTTHDIWGHDLPDLTYPVAVGRAAQLAGLPLDLTMAMYVQAFAGNLVSAAIRLVPLGQTEGQGVLAALAPTCAALAKDLQDATLDELHSSAFLSDIAAMAHETLETRIFRS
ncbi:MAG: urease accessory protein UreF [Sedimentitalea sp.]